jgi:hypothetical protein
VRHTVYFLTEPHDPSAVRYVGVTSRALQVRVQEHVASMSQIRVGPRLREWLLTLWPEWPGIRACCIVDTKEEAERIEEVLSEKMRQRGVPLLNVGRRERAEIAKQLWTPEKRDEKSREYMGRPGTRGPETEEMYRARLAREAYSPRPARDLSSYPPTTIVGRLVRKLESRKAVHNADPERTGGD